LAAKIEQTTAIEEIDLHKLVWTICHSWMTLIIFIVIGGLGTGLYSFLSKPTYKATAIVSIDSSALLTNTSPIFLLQSDAVKSEVAQSLNMAIENLPDVTFSIDKIDKTIIYISTSTDNKDLSVKLVNFWADSSVKLINRDDEIAKNEISTIQQTLDSADSALFAYLQQTGLGSLTWVDLVSITGVTNDQLNMTLLDITKDYPKLTSKQKIELTNLVRQKMLAEWNFTRVNESILSNHVPMDLRAKVLNRAYQSEKTNILTPYLMVPIGLILGFLVAVVWILIKNWWDNSDPVANESKKTH
jgi:capsular polysaccharide biosynthesis protein